MKWFIKLFQPKKLEIDYEKIDNQKLIDKLFGSVEFTQQMTKYIVESHIVNYCVEEYFEKLMLPSVKNQPPPPKEPQPLDSFYEFCKLKLSHLDIDISKS